MDPFLHKSLPNQLYSSRYLPPVSEYEALNPSIVLFPIEGTGSWDHTAAEIDDNQLIGPAIMSLCPFHVLSMLNWDQHNDDTLSLHQFGKIILGTATVAQFGPLSNFGWVNAIFVLRQNYLLEYKCDRNNINEKPRGYAHLQHSTVRAHPEFPNALELVISDNNRIQKGKKVVRTTLSVLSEGQILNSSIITYQLPIYLERIMKSC